jgi:hypothetical protein
MNLQNIPKGKRPYVALYKGKRAELWATSLLEAKQMAIEELKVPKSKTGLLAVILADVTHDTGSL